MDWCSIFANGRGPLSDKYFSVSRENVLSAEFLGGNLRRITSGKFIRTYPEYR